MKITDTNGTAAEHFDYLTEETDGSDADLIDVTTVEPRPVLAEELLRKRPA